MKERDNIEDLFVSAFHDEQVTPPSGVKQKIDRKLFGQRRVVLRIVSLFLLLVSIGGGIWFFMNGNNQGLQEGKSQMAEQEVVSQERANHQKMNERTVEEGAGKTGVVEKETVDTESETPEVVSSGAKRGQKNQERTLLKRKDKEITEKDGRSNTLTELTGEKKNEGVDTEIPEETLAESGSEEKLVEYVGVYEAAEEQKKGADDIQKSSGQDIVRTEEVKDSTLIVQEEVVAQEGTEEDTKEDLSSEEESAAPDINPDKEQSRSLLTVSLYGGSYYGINFLKDASNNPLLGESSPWSASVEVSGSLRNNFGWTTGLGISGRKDNYSYSELLFDSTLVNSYWIWDSTLQDTVWINTYAYNSTNTTYASQISTTTFSLPLYLNYKKSFGQHWNMVLSGGALFSYVRTKTLTSDFGFIAPDQKAFGMSLVFRPELRYNFSQFGIGIYTSGSYNFITGTQWLNASRRRMQLGGGISLSVSF